MMQPKVVPTLSPRLYVRKDEPGMIVSTLVPGYSHCSPSILSLKSEEDILQFQCLSFTI